MASGIQVSDDVKNIYMDMKLGKNVSDQGERIRIVVMHIVDDKSIEVQKVYTENDLDGKDIFQFFQSLLVPSQCCYLLYDCHYETNESKKKELVFATWCPDDGPVNMKMKYASSKAYMKNHMPGLKHNLQFNELGDCIDRKCFAEHLRCADLYQLEGKDMCCKK